MKDLFGEPLSNGDMIRSAWFSDCGIFRYSLTRFWGDGPKAVALLQNPSKAGHLLDDPTTSQNVNRFCRLGFGKYEAVNIRAAVGTDPESLASMDDPVGPENDSAIRTALRSADMVVVMFGSHPMVKARLPAVWPLLEPYELWCLGTNQDGMPRFPRAIPRDTPLRPWKIDIYM